MKVQLNSRVTPEIYARVEERATQIERTLSETVNRILAEYFTEYDKRKRSNCACV